MSFHRIVVAIVVAPLIIPALSGCATYRQQKVEAAQKANIETIRAGISPRDAPVAKSGRVVIPSKTLLVSRLTSDFVATYYVNSYRATAELIRQRNIFEQLDIEESADGGHVTPKTTEAVIYLYVPDNKTSGWYYISKTTKRTPLNSDSGNPDKVGRFKYFLDSIEALASDEPK